MTSIIKFESISGVQDESPPCYILNVDEFRFLLDCGWDEKFETAHYDELKNRIKDIDAVLLSYPDITHIGALPYLVGKCNLACPIYSTVPVYKMGQMFLYDLYQSRYNNEDFKIFNLDDVDKAFALIEQLKYSQTVNLREKGHGIQITPLAAGHMLGGTMWKIVKDGEEEIIYAIDFNHKKERHLAGANFENISRPSVLISDCFNILYHQPRRRNRDQQLFETLLRTVRGGGNALVAIDTAGRSLEIALMLDQVWRQSDASFSAYNLVFLNNVAYNVIEFAKSQLEWMSDQLMRSIEDNRTNPFHLKHATLCHTLKDVQHVPDPKVVLASVADMECGFARELFIQWAHDSRNAIILTQRSSPGTLARKLIDKIQTKKGPLAEELQETIEVRKRVPLRGAELEEYLKKEKESAAVKTTSGNVVTVEEDSSSSDDEDEILGFLADGLVGSMTKPSSKKAQKAPKHDLMVRLPGASTSGSRSGFFKQAAKHHPMYPVKEERIRWDDYGEIIKPEDYLIVDSIANADDDAVVPGATSDLTASATGLSSAKGSNTAATANTQSTSVLQSANTAVNEAIASKKPIIATKCTTSTHVIPIRASLSFIDFEGRSDGESVKRIITAMKPKQLIIVHGTSASTEALAKYFTESAPNILSSASSIHSPKIGQVVDLTTERNIYQVILKDSLVSALRFQNVQGRGDTLQVSWIDGCLNPNSSNRSSSQDKNKNDDDGDDDNKKDRTDSSGGGGSTATVVKTKNIDQRPTLEPHPDEKPIHQAVFINEPRLSDMKALLLKHNIHAEFSAGTLICGEGVALRKTGAGKITIEGAMSDEFYYIRELLYQQFAII